MKTIKQFSFALALAITTILSSCSGSDSGGGGGAAAGTIVAKAGSTSFKSMSIASYASNQGSMLIIQGSDASGKAIQLIVFGAAAVGTYEINDASEDISAVGSYTVTNLSNPANSQTWAAPYEDSGVVGSITISEITETAVKGTFHFTGKNESGTDTKAVTNGSFNVNFQS